MNPIILDLQSVHFTEEQFFQLCINNPQFRFEKNAQGELIVMPPTGGETSKAVPILNGPDFLSGELILPGFQLDLRVIW